MFEDTNSLSGLIIAEAIGIHRKLGPGLLESVYEEILYYRINKIGLAVERQVPIPVVFEGVNLEIGFRADLIVEQEIIVEIKSVEMVKPVHCKQLLTYLKLANLNLGLIINFNEELLKQGIKRIVNNLVE